MALYAELLAQAQVEEQLLLQQTEDDATMAQEEQLLEEQTFAKKQKTVDDQIHDDKIFAGRCSGADKTDRTRAEQKAAKAAETADRLTQIPGGRMTAHVQAASK